MTRGPGRPSIGQAVEVRLTSDTVERLDAEAERLDVKRAELLRRIVENFVAQLPRRRRGGRRRPPTTITTTEDNQPTP